MGRPSRSRHLSLWANGVRVGRWSWLARGEMELRYDDSWVNDPRGRPLSLSLPFNLHGQALKGESVFNYFDNLLPDSEAIRRRAAERFVTGSVDPFNLLKAIGRDCVGALQILGEDETPEGVDRLEGVPLSEEDIERHLVEAVMPKAFGAGHDSDDDFRISLAGAQEKTALLRHEGHWLVPRGATPTTHIFKLPLGLVGSRKADMSTSVDNEWLCLRLMRAYGLNATLADIMTFGQQRVLVVERFDRRPSSDGTWLLRLMQEDFCQVTGCSPLKKYETDGGPRLETLFSILNASQNAQEDKRTLLASQILFWLLRSPDGHAKNFSIELLPRGRFKLTPLYDVMSAYPVMGPGLDQFAPQKVKLAMGLSGKNRHYTMNSIQRRHFNSTARKVGYGQDAEELIGQILERTPLAIAEVHAELPVGFSQKVADTVLGGLTKAADALAAMAP